MSLQVTPQFSTDSAETPACAGGRCLLNRQVEPAVSTKCAAGLFDGLTDRQVELVCGAAIVAALIVGVVAYAVGFAWALELIGC